MKKIRLFLTVLFAMVYASTASAVIVFDPTNYIQTTITAINSAANEAREQLRVIRDLKNISNALSGISGISDIANAIQDVQQLVMVTTRLKSELESMGQVSVTFKNMYGASNARTGSDFIAQLAKRERAGDASVTALMDNAKEIQKKIERSSQQHQMLVDSLSGIEGITQAAISTTAAVGIVIQQNQTLLGAYEATQMTEAAKVAEKIAKEKANTDRQLEYRVEMERRLRAP